jgi:NAD(P)-dependent dehydrogenase (short-subunit alcohol dehydrogenase family)
MRGLSAKVIIVTGAASGIGRASAARLLEEGSAVMGADVSPIAEPPARSDGQRWASTVCDVTDEESVARLIETTIDRFGRVDGLVTAAGVAGAGPVHLLSTDEWERVLAVNLTGTFLCAKHLLEVVLARNESPEHQRASIVTIASIEGLEGTAGGSVYCASKGGVVQLTRNMAIDYGPRGIRVNTICPGFIETPMTAGIFGLPGMEKVVEEFVCEHSLRRMGRPEEIAAVAAFLLSDDASFISGHALTVDGGYTAGRDHGITRLLGLEPDPRG